MGSDAVLVPQVEAYRKDFVDWIFDDTSLTFSEFMCGAAESANGRNSLTRRSVFGRILRFTTFGRSLST